MKNEQESDFWIRFGFIAVGALVFYYIGRNWGNYQIKAVIVWIFVVIFAIIAGETVIWVSRYYMPRVCVNNFSGSILGKPVILKDRDGILWAVINTGEYLEPFHGKGKLATLVVPFKQLHEAGRNYIALTFVRRFPAKSLPHVVYNFLQHSYMDYNLNAIYFGKYSEEFYDSNPAIPDYEAMIARLNTQINLRDDLIEGRNDELIEMTEFAKQISGTDKHWYDVLKRSPQANQEVQK